MNYPKDTTLLLLLFPYEEEDDDEDDTSFIPAGRICFFFKTINLEKYIYIQGSSKKNKKKVILEI